MLNKKLISIVVTFSMMTTVSPAIGWSCTTVSASNGQRTYAAKNYDWSVTTGAIFVNQRNVLKRSMALSPSDGELQWRSKYGSVTLNQYGREFPNSGLNEAGLLVEIMWLDKSVYPQPDARPAMNQLQWIQYMLDNAGTASEVVSLAESVRISPVNALVHFMACDKSGACATLEFLDGSLVVHQGAELPYKVLTNNTYAESLDFLKEHIGFGGDKKIPSGEESLPRFARAAKNLSEFSFSRRAIPQLFHILEGSKQADTVWQVAYDLTNGRIFFRTFDHVQLRSISLQDVQFECGNPVKMFMMRSTVKGDIVPHMTNYSFDANHSFVRETILATPLELTEQEKELLIGAISHYPESTVCHE